MFYLAEPYRESPNSPVSQGLPARWVPLWVLQQQWGISPFSAEKEGGNGVRMTIASNFIWSGLKENDHIGYSLKTCAYSWTAKGPVPLQKIIISPFRYFLQQGEEDAQVTFLMSVRQAPWHSHAQAFGMLMENLHRCEMHHGDTKKNLIIK